MRCAAKFPLFLLTAHSLLLFLSQAWKRDSLKLRMSILALLSVYLRSDKSDGREAVFVAVFEAFFEKVLVALSHGVSLNQKEMEYTAVNFWNSCAGAHGCRRGGGALASAPTLLLRTASPLPPPPLLRRDPRHYVPGTWQEEL